MAKSDDIQVLISYKRLTELVQASEQVEALRKDCARLEAQVLALRMIQSECIEKIRYIEKYL